MIRLLPLAVLLLASCVNFPTGNSPSTSVGYLGAEPSPDPTTEAAVYQASHQAARRTRQRTAGAGKKGPAGPMISGMIGVTDVKALNLEFDPSFATRERDDQITMPMLGAQFIFPARTEGLEWGFESGFSIGFESDRDAVVLDTGAVLVHSDNEMCIGDLSVGLYVAKTFGGRTRIYGGAGPLLQYASIDLEFDQPILGEGGIDEDGIGFGFYTRAGIEIEMSPGTLVGVGFRWVESDVDPGGHISEIDLEALQVALTVTTGF